MRIVVREIRARGRRADWSTIKAAAEQVMRDTIAPRFASYPKRITDPWKHKMTFETTFKVTRKAISLYVYPTGGNAKYWRWVSRGTPEHDIYPKKAKRLAYQHIWVPKTSPGGHYGGAGVKSGEWWYSTHEHHPGITPRLFEERWAEWSRPWFRPTIEKAMRQAARKR